MPPKRKKTFDCVEFQHEAGRRVEEKMRHMTTEQKVEYWKKRTEEILATQKEMRAAPPARRSD